MTGPITIFTMLRGSPVQHIRADSESHVRYENKLIKPTKETVASINVLLCEHHFYLDTLQGSHFNILLFT